MPAPFGGARTKDVFFLPFQRERMLERIRADINNGLEALITEYGDIFYRYEIGDDFRQVRIYLAPQMCIHVAPGQVCIPIPHELHSEVNYRFSSLIALYHNINTGSGGGFQQNIVVFVEASGLQR